jgi:hypothetical protein
VLGEAGCPRAGEAVLRPAAAALDAASEWRQALQQTLAELAARAGDDPDHCADFAAGSGGRP